MQTPLLTTVIGGAMLAAFALGWLVPLIIGIVRTAKGQRSSGLIVLGALWGSVGLFFGGIAIVGLLTFRRVQEQTNVKPFDASLAGDQVATLTVPFGGKAVVQFVSKDGMKVQTYTSNAENGAVLVATGKITPISVTFTGTDTEGGIWNASSYFQGRRRKELMLAAGDTHELRVGPPFEARVLLNGESTGRQHLDFKLKGTGGNAFTIRKHGSANKPPSFEVVDEKGDVVWHGNFAYG